MNLFPFSRFEVKGESMSPRFNSGDRVITSNFNKIKENDVIILNKNSKTMIKRVKKIIINSYYVLGDNLEKSIDSRDFGLVTKDEVKGKVLFKY